MGLERGSGKAPGGSWCESAAEGGGRCRGRTWAWSRPAGATTYGSIFGFVKKKRKQVLFKISFRFILSLK